MALDHPAVARHRVAGLEHDDVTQDQVAGGDLDPLAVADDPAPAGTRACSASAVFSAEYSWAKPMTALRTTTARMAMASCRLPTSLGLWMA